MRKCIQGFTLLEIMIALALSSLVLLVILNHFSGVKSQNVTTLWYNQKNTRQVLVKQSLTNALRGAGEAGCLRLGSASIDVPAEEHLSPPIAVYQSGDKKRPKVIAGKALASSDVLAISRIGLLPVQLAKGIHRGAQLIINAPTTLKAGERYYIGSCLHGEFFTVMSMHCSTKTCEIVLKKPLRYSYPYSAVIGILHTCYWFIGTSSAEGKRVRALMRQYDKSPRQEISRGFSLMRLFIHHQQLSVILAVTPKKGHQSHLLRLMFYDLPV